MTMDVRVRRTWRDAPVTRVLGSALGWFSGALAITLLFQVASAVAAVGGYCARGGPYVIAVECSDAVVVFAPTSVLGGLAGVGIGMMLAQGFGASLVAFAWPALFVSLSVTFFQTFFLAGDIVGLIIGVLFAAMGLAPLVVMMRAAPQRTLLGRVDAQGRAFFEPGENHPSPADWALSLGTAMTASSLGVWLGVVWFTAVATGGA